MDKSLCECVSNLLICNVFWQGDALVLKCFYDTVSDRRVGVTLVMFSGYIIIICTAL